MATSFAVDMDSTPTRASRSRNVEVNVLDEARRSPRHHEDRGRIRKPPPITPRRFNKFFTPRPRNVGQAIKTSRKALRTISSSTLNIRRQPALYNDVDEGYLPANENGNPRKKRKYSLISSNQTTPARSVSFLPSSQDALPSSPVPYGRDKREDDVDVDSDVSTEIDEAAWSADEHEELPTGPRITPYAGIGTSRSLLSSRLTGRRRICVADSSNLWQHETADFYSTADDINHDLCNRLPQIIPFSMAACHTNPIVATGDEEGIVRLLNTEDGQNRDGFHSTILSFQPHDNAVMDLTFSNDDLNVATASGDQTCQVVDVRAQRSLYSLRGHTASVKRVEFQPGSGNKILASAGRDGTICLWDLRVKGQSLGNGRRARLHVTDMASDMSILAPVLEIKDAHNPNGNTKGTSRKPQSNTIAARQDFSITSLSFLDSSRSNLLATASEVETVIKVWDLRKSQVSARKQGHSGVPVSTTAEPRSHEIHRKFGINSVAMSTDNSRLFALSRDHTVYAYSTSHLILGSSPDFVPCPASERKTLGPMRTESGTGIGPIYGLRHPQLRVATFWPRIAIRKHTATNTELLAVASTDDCTILFPTSERYHTPSTRKMPPLHDPSRQATSTPTLTRNDSQPTSRPSLNRAPTTSFTSLFTSARQQEDNLPIYYHGTPLIHGHDKEVTSVAWSSQGNLVTASDDFTVRCWRQNANEARRLRNARREKDAASTIKAGWAHVGFGDWDEED